MGSKSPLMTLLVAKFQNIVRLLAVPSLVVKL
jgi:hypothetical protein